MSGLLGRFLRPTREKHRVLAEGYVMPETSRCVQCGICSYNCPIAIDVRLHAIQGRPIHDPHCLTCGECVARCPRGVLRFELEPEPDPEGRP